MAEKDDRENLGDDLGQRQRQFLLELSSVRQDRVPSLGIEFARMIRSNDVISCCNVTLPFCSQYQRQLRRAPEGDKKKSGGSPTTGLCIPLERTSVGYENHIFRNRFLPGPFRIALVRKTPNEACCHGRHSFAIYL